MDKYFVPYEQALALKELGFDEPCFGYFDPLYKQLVVWEKESTNSSSNWVSAPLYQQAFRWFREKYGLHSTITSISQESWQWHITKPGESLGKLYDEDFYTYEEAELECLKKLIEIVKEN
jgi:hypothetical protein